MLKSIRKYMYLRAMMRAIDIARTDVLDQNYKTSKVNGLKAIRTFERINRIDFDPFNKDHLRTVAGYGTDIAFYRKMGRILKQTTNKYK